MSCAPSRVVVTVGEDKTFKIFLREEETGNPVDLSSYTIGTVNFCNCKEEKITASVPMPGSNPLSGEISVTLTPTETDLFDKSMKDIQIELNDGSLTRIIVLKNVLEVMEQIC